MNRLFKEGLLSKESFTLDRDGLKKIAENPNIAIGGAIPAHSPSDITIVEGSSNRWLDYQPIAPVKGRTDTRRRHGWPMIKSGAATLS